MLKTTQWVKVPRGASGSSQIRARLRVPAGGSVHFSEGELFWPSPVYCRGIACPSWKAGLVTSRAMVGAPVLAVLPADRPASQAAQPVDQLAQDRFLAL